MYITYQIKFKNKQYLNYRLIFLQLFTKLGNQIVFDNLLHCTVARCVFAYDQNVEYETT